MANQTANNPTSVHDEGATIFVALELSLKSWLVGIRDPLSDRVSQFSIPPADLAKLLYLISKRVAKVERVLAMPVQVRSCFEAGYEGFWLHRCLLDEGVVNLVIDPASLLVNRRARQRKTDRIDVRRLLRALQAYCRGDKEGAFSVVRVPSVEQEDAKHPHRERKRLHEEQTGHINRIRGLMVQRGIYGASPLSRRFRARLDEMKCGDGLPLAPHLKAEIERELDRLTLVRGQLLDLDRMREQALEGPAEVSTSKFMAQLLLKLKGIGLEGSTTLVYEVFYRDFRNRRQIASYVGLDGTPFDSGSSKREQGISKAGNARVRALMVQLAWLWLRHQPDSALSKWFRERVGDGKGRQRRIMIVALARKLLIALWRFATEGLIPEGAVFKS